MGDVTINDKDYTLETKDEALILAIQELTEAIRKVSQNG